MVEQPRRFTVIHNIYKVALNYRAFPVPLPSCFEARQ